MEVICIQSEALDELIRQVTVTVIAEMAKQKEDEWVNPKEAMRLLGIKSTSLQKLRDQGHIRYSQPSRKNIMYYRPSLYLYLEKNAKEPFR